MNTEGNTRLRLTGWRQGFRKHLRTSAIVAGVALAVAATSVQAQQTAVVAINRVSISSDSTTLFIFGEHFGAVAPAVTINGQTLAGVAVDPAGTTISALMPVPPIPPGTYRLLVTRPGGVAPVCPPNPGDPGYFVTLPGGGMVPCNHPLAVGAVPPPSSAEFVVTVQASVGGPAGPTAWRPSRTRLASDRSARAVGKSG